MLSGVAMVTPFYSFFLLDLGQGHTRERYLPRGRFSKRRFEAECLSEYAEVVLGIFRFPLKVPEDITRWEFAQVARYGARSGERNAAFGRWVF